MHKDGVDADFVALFKDEGPALGCPETPLGIIVPASSSALDPIRVHSKRSLARWSGLRSGQARRAAANIRFLRLPGEITI
jgi:hypothetical protein